MKEFCKSLKEHAKSIIDFEKKSILPLTQIELKADKDAKICYLCGKYFRKKLFNDKNNSKLRDHCHYTGKYRGVARSICILKLNVPNEIPVVFHNDSKYDFHLKELANEFDGQCDCIAENSEKYKSFSIPTNKVVKINKEGNKTTEFMSYKIEFIDSVRFMATSLSTLADILTGGIPKLKWKNCYYFLEYKNVKYTI